MFDHPEHDLTNASSDRSIKIGTCQELKTVTRKEEEKRMDEPLVSPRCQKGSDHVHTEINIEVNIQKSPDIHFKHSPMKDSTKSQFHNGHTTDFGEDEDEAIDESDDHLSHISIY